MDLHFGVNGVQITSVSQFSYKKAAPRQPANAGCSGSRQITGYKAAELFGSSPSCYAREATTKKLKVPVEK
jgi:hypothetical protein